MKSRNPGSEVNFEIKVENDAVFELELCERRIAWKYFSVIIIKRKWSDCKYVIRLLFIVFNGNQLNSSLPIFEMLLIKPKKKHSLVDADMYNYRWELQRRLIEGCRQWIVCNQLKLFSNFVLRFPLLTKGFARQMFSARAPLCAIEHDKAIHFWLF